VWGGGLLGVWVSILLSLSLLLPCGVSPAHCMRDVDCFDCCSFLLPCGVSPAHCRKGSGKKKTGKKKSTPIRKADADEKEKGEKQKKNRTERIRRTTGKLAGNRWRGEGGCWNLEVSDKGPQVR
jgi:hypothetical protein